MSNFFWISDEDVINIDNVCNAVFYKPENDPVMRGNKTNQRLKIYFSNSSKMCTYCIKNEVAIKLKNEMKMLST